MTRLTHYPISNNLFSEIDRFFNRGVSPTETSCYAEACGEADESGWKLRFELPGFKKDEVRLSVDADHLSIEASTDDETRKFLGKIERRVRISDEADVENIHAKLEDGLLYLEIPKKVKAKPVSIVLS